MQNSSFGAVARWRVLGSSVAGALAMLAGHQVCGQIVLTAGTWSMPTETTLSIDFFVLNAGAPVTVEGLDFFVETPAGTGPKIQSVDLVTGTAFASDNFGGNNPDTADNTPNSQYVSVVQSPSVAGSPMLATGSTKVATVVFSSVGVNPADYTLLLKGTILGTTDYTVPVPGTFPGQLGITVNNGNITVTPVPEPVEMALGTGLILVAFGAWRRFRA